MDRIVLRAQRRYDSFYAIQRRIHIFLEALLRQKKK